LEARERSGSSKREKRRNVQHKKASEQESWNLTQSGSFWFEAVHMKWPLDSPEIIVFATVL